MKRIFSLVLFLCVFTGGLYAQAVGTTVCDVLKNPKAFDGKMVSIKGTVVAGLDQFVVTGDNCGQDVNAIWLSYPEGAKVKSGPLAMLQVEPAHNFAGQASSDTRTPVTLQKDKEFKKFDSLLSQYHTTGTGLCPGCPRYHVQATLVGRLDGVMNAGLTRNAAGKIVGLGGFGNMNAYPARLVIQSVSDVTPQAVDYSKSDAIVNKGSENTQPGQGPSQAPANPTGFGYGDPLTVAEKAAADLQPSQVTTQIQNVLAEFPKGKQQNGVIIGYGAMNEVAAGSAPSAQDTTDGLVYECTFNRDRLGDALSMALVHLGQHISDLRAAPGGNGNAPLYVMENNAWVVSASIAVAEGVRYLTMPGGYLLWNPAWTNADRTDNMKSALDSFLTQEEHLSQ